MTKKTLLIGAALLLLALSSVRAGPSVYPNPFRPDRGHTNVTMDALPAGAHLRIYAMDGLLVRDLTAGPTGRALWDGRTAEGHEAASGTYFVFWEGGGTRGTFKVHIQR